MNRHNTATKKNSLDLGDYAAVIGIDWADQRHAVATVALPRQEQAQPELSTLEHKTDALIEWISSLQERFAGGRIAIAIEQRKGALIHFLSAFDFIDLYPIEPLSLKSYRKALYPSGAQSDPVDAALLAEFLLKHRAQLRCYRPQSAPVRQCAQYCEDRRRFVDQRAQALQCLKASLKLYFPLALELFEDLSTSLANAFIRRWPTLEELQRVRPATLRAFFYRHGSRSPKLIERRLQLIAAARALTMDRGVIEPQALRVKCLLEHIATLSRSIHSYQERIQSLVPSLDSDGVFASLPGAGTCFAPRLAVLFGPDRSRFESAAEVQMLTGTAPVTCQSGKKKLVTMRWACSTFQRQTLVEYALASIRFSSWARTFYDLHMPSDPNADKPTYSVLRKLAFKWLRIIYRCWQTRTPYDESRYIQSLRRSSSPVWHRLQQANAPAPSSL
jgi:transposase